jgi:hypothetical protein
VNGAHVDTEQGDSELVDHYLLQITRTLDNLGAFQRWFGCQPNTKAATLIFSLLHGFGLTTKIQEYEISADGLITNNWWQWPEG